MERSKFSTALLLMNQEKKCEEICDSPTRRNYDSPMRVKKRSAKKLQFSNRSQGKKSQERNCDSPIRVKKSAKKISDDPIRIELEILALKMTPHKQNQE